MSKGVGGEMRYEKCDLGKVGQQASSRGRVGEW